jgi:hypothetical protein
VSPEAGDYVGTPLLEGRRGGDEAFVDFCEEPGSEVVEKVVVGCEVGFDELGDCHFLEFCEEIGLVKVLEFLEEAFFDIIVLGLLLLSRKDVLRLHQFEWTC